MAALVAGALLVVPAGASANLVVTQSASPKPVKKGELVTITVTATNSGPRTLSGTDAGVDLFSLLGSTDRAADNPYQSAVPSQGTCELKPQGAYHVASCLLGELGVGASAQITAIVRVNESMNHVAAPPNDTWSEIPVAAGVPPVLRGSAKVTLAGLPETCALGDFTLTITSRAPRTRQIRASLFLGYDEEGAGITYERSAKGRRLKATIPVSKLYEPKIGRPHKITIYAYRKGAHALKRTISFEPCL
jgi:Domain of unknown function DUF11